MQDRRWLTGDGGRGTGEDWKIGRVEGWEGGAFERLNPSLRSGQAVSTLERGLVSCSACMNEDPPFGGNDAAGNFDSPGKVVCLRGQLKNTSSESLKTEFADLSLQFCKE
jgi:hypothetical protein